MQIISDKRCIIGEGPIWNEKEEKLYYTNGFGNEICVLDIYTGELTIRPVSIGCAAFCFDKDNNLIVSRNDGVHILHKDNTTTPLCDKIKLCNDMKVGPDGRIYVGTKSEPGKVNGKLYSIDKSGEVRLLLDGIVLSNGLDWSMDEKKFYHIAGGDNLIREYDFDKKTGDIYFTGRDVEVLCGDGMTIDKNNNLLVACWGTGHISVVDTETMTVTDKIAVPCDIPTSCGFAGKNMDILSVTTASYNASADDEYAGFTLLFKKKTGGRKPYIFGAENE